MESGPAIFAGTVFVLFGAALLVWTGARVLHRAPVAQGVNPVASATLATVAGAGALLLGIWCFAGL
ncbi:hypothetical protein [Streptomyces himalayensis]|uniref:Uncharacterized protein n=2 Tax=Streptomyces himalayensis TaxID=2820085 RepID=A0A7W2HHB5_9ACTN|nr:hypothetical protein [Streptomyces himalayensis]MBA2945060.1 hypothetical protein [Streptomyces himalayensis subsp. himalayensis]MBA4863852.1 hypothetical protein [Streptomyces himalayensis subsp. aureolus]